MNDETLISSKITSIKKYDPTKIDEKTRSALVSGICIIGTTSRLYSNFINAEDSKKETNVNVALQNEIASIEKYSSIRRQIASFMISDLSKIATTSLELFHHIKYKTPTNKQVEGNNKTQKYQPLDYCNIGSNEDLDGDI